MTPLRPPSKQEAIEGQIDSATVTIKEAMAENGLESYKEAANELLESYSAEDLAALLIKQIAKDDASEVPVNITPERPLPNRGGKRGGGNRGGGNRGGNRGGNNRGGNRGGNNRGGNRDNNGKRDYDKKNRDKNKPGENRKRSNNNQNSNQNKDKSRGFTIRNNAK